MVYVFDQVGLTEDQTTAKFLPLWAGKDGDWLGVKEMFILLMLQRVKTPDSIWIIVYIISIFPHLGSYVEI